LRYHCHYEPVLLQDKAGFFTLFSFLSHASHPLALNVGLTDDGPSSLSRSDPSGWEGKGLQIQVSAVLYALPLVI